MYEMATAERLPRGQPPALAGFPAAYAHTVERCLQQDPDDRWQSARDIQAELEWAAENGVTETVAESGKRINRWLPIAAALLLIAIAGAWALARHRRRVSRRQRDVRALGVHLLQF